MGCRVVLAQNELPATQMFAPSPEEMGQEAGQLP